jgi:phosphocarrier protein HPr
MTERNATIVNELGLHARPAAQFVRTAAQFTSSIELIRDGSSVNGKSIMGVMMLAAECGAVVTVRADGADEAAAVDALVTLIERGFGE